MFQALMKRIRLSGDSKLGGPVRNFVFEAYSCSKENICLANRKSSWQTCL